MTPFGQRAIIDRVGVCEPLPNGGWWLTGWSFSGAIVRHLTTGGRCAYVHNDEGYHIGIFGWLFTDLKAMSEEALELAKLDTQVPDRQIAGGEEKGGTA